MPHVIVKMHAGRTETEKLAMAERVVAAIGETLGLGPENLSLAVEEVAPGDWMEKVYESDIAGCEDQLLKRPGYGPLAAIR